MAFIEPPKLRPPLCRRLPGPVNVGRAALLAMNGNTQEAAEAYRKAIAAAPHRAEALFLQRRLAQLDP